MPVPIISNASLGRTLVLCLFLPILAALPARAQEDSPNTLTQEASEAGWVLLFDGATLNGWRGLGRDDIPEGHWTVEDGAIRKIASGIVPIARDGQPLVGGDIITVDTYDNFEFSFEWRVSKAANSGIKYNVSEEMSVASLPRSAALGFEYQILDDDNHPDAQNGPNRTAGALYDLIPPPADKLLRPVGTFNHGRIVVQGTHAEHWLNGVKVVEYDLDSDAFKAALEASKYAPVEGFADKRKGHIVLQDHRDDVWFRNLKIRPLHADHD